MKKFNLLFSFWFIGMVLMSPALLWGQTDLTLYTYDSFNSEWGPGPVVFKRFEEECECKLKVVAPGDSGSMLNRAILEKNNPRADLVLGINNSELDKSFQYEIWEPYRPRKWTEFLRYSKSIRNTESPPLITATSRLCMTVNGSRNRHKAWKI